MNRIVASAQISLMDYNDAIVTGNMPANPEKDMLWLNTSVNPHIMKQYTGSEWITVGELDPEYTEKLEVITGNITDLELTLGNMADDGKLDYGDRQEIVDKLLPIIGYLPVNTSATLKTVSQLDTDKKGSFYQLRQAAQNAGIVTSNTAYTGLASAWNALRTYLGGLDPKPWDLSTGTTGNQDAVAQVDKGTFRTHWLNYYNAEYTLATATTQILHSAISTINTTTLPAMRDSALSSAEKTAIKQSLIILSSEKTAMDGEITGLKANPKLENQTPLNEAKSVYDTSYTGVTTAINAVLAVPTGTLIPSNLILEVEDAVSSYSAKLSLLKKAMQDSQTAIAKKVSDDASRELSDSLEGYVDKITYGQDIEEIQNQVDGAIMTWFGDNEPTLLTAPAKEWNTTALKDVHLGDLYYDNKSGYAYRFGKDGTGYLWIRIVDADVVAALAAAQNAQDTADGKRRAFYNQPTPPYDAGDLWVQGEKGELKRAVVTRDKNGLYHENDWVKAVKYTDDTAVENLEIGGRNLLKNTGLTDGTSGWSGTSRYELNGENVFRVAGTMSAVPNILVEPNQYYTTTIEIYPTVDIPIDNSRPLHAYYNTSSGSGNAFSGVASKVSMNGSVAKANEWTRITEIVRTTQDVTTYKLHVYYPAYINSTTPAYVRNIKFEKGNKATDWTPAPEDVEKSISDSLTAAESYANTIKTGLETQIDGKVETYNQTADPATGWTAEEKTKHKGDLWYHPTNKITKLWSGSSWTTLEDAVATGAQQLAQAKNRVFTSTPTTPYEIGDLWVQGTSGDLMRCVTTRASGSFNINDWEKATKYTDDTKANAAATAASNAQTAANNAQADAKKANDSVSDIISDNKMTPDEKVILQREWLNIQYERNEILSQAERYVIDNASYRSVYDTLNVYLAPFFTNLTTTQNVNGETLRSNFQRYYEQRQATLDAISVAAQQKVLDLQTQVDAGPFVDKTDVLSGTEIFTDKADDSVVHAEIDGKSCQHVNPNARNMIPTDYKDWEDGHYSLNGIKEIYANRIRVPWLVKVEPNTAYYWNSNDSSTQFVIRSLNSDGTFNSSWGGVNSSGSRTTSGSEHYLGIALYNNSDYEAKFNNGTIKPLFQLASNSDKRFEEFVPPAPSPDYPIEIHSVNDFDVVSQKSEGRTIDDIEIGGRNYVLNSDFLEEKKHWVLQGERNALFSNSAVILSSYNELSGENDSVYQNLKIERDVKVIASVLVKGEGVLRLRFGGGDIHKKDFTINSPNEFAKIHADFPNTGNQNFMLMLVGKGELIITNVKLEKGNKATDWTPAPEDISEGDNHPLINKTNILLSEPLRSVGDVKDKLFRDNDGLWKIERNVGELVVKGSDLFSISIGADNNVASTRMIDNLGKDYSVPFQSSHYKKMTSPPNRWQNISNIGTGTVTTDSRMWLSINKQTIDTVAKARIWFDEELSKGTPVVVNYQLVVPIVETLPQTDQDKLNNIASFKDSNYLYTIVDKTNILPSHIRGNLNPNLKVTFKSQAWYQNYKRGDDLRHFVEVKGLDRAIRFGMLVDYQSFAMPTANWLYFCKIQTNTNDFREELVDEDGSIFDYTTQREIKVPKQPLDLRGVAEGTTGYLAFDTRNQLVWFIHYQRNYTYTTNQETGIVEKIPSSEYWIKWNPGKTGHNTQLILDESVYIVGEIER